MSQLSKEEANFVKDTAEYYGSDNLSVVFRKYHNSIALYIRPYVDDKPMKPEKVSWWKLKSVTEEELDEAEEEVYQLLGEVEDGEYAGEVV